MAIDCPPQREHFSVFELSRVLVPAQGVQCGEETVFLLVEVRLQPGRHPFDVVAQLLRVILTRGEVGDQPPDSILKLGYHRVFLGERAQNGRERGDSFGQHRESPSILAGVVVVQRSAEVQAVRAQLRRQGRSDSPGFRDLDAGLSQIVNLTAQVRELGAQPVVYLEEFVTEALDPALIQLSLVQPAS